MPEQNPSQEGRVFHGTHEYNLRPRRATSNFLRQSTRARKNKAPISMRARKTKSKIQNPPTLDEETDKTFRLLGSTIVKTEGENGHGLYQSEPPVSNENLGTLPAEKPVGPSDTISVHHVSEIRMSVNKVMTMLKPNTSPKILPKYSCEGPSTSAVGSISREANADRVKIEGHPNHSKPLKCRTNAGQKDQNMQQALQTLDPKHRSSPTSVSVPSHSPSTSSSSITIRNKYLKRLRRQNLHLPTIALPNSAPAPCSSISEDNPNIDRDNPNDPQVWAMVPFHPDVPAATQTSEYNQTLIMDEDTPLSYVRLRSRLVYILPHGPIRLVSGSPAFVGEWRISNSPEILPGREDMYIMRVAVRGEQELQFLHVDRFRPSTAEFEFEHSLQVTEDIVGRHPEKLYGPPLVVNGETYCTVQFQGCDFIEIVEAGLFFAKFPELETDHFATNREHISSIEDGRVEHSASSTTCSTQTENQDLPRSKMFYCVALFEFL